MLELGRVGLLNRRARLRFRPLKTDAQKRRLRELFEVVDLPSLAGALGASEAALVESVPVGDGEQVGAFVTMVAQTGSEPARRALLDQVLVDKDVALTFAVPLVSRATLGERRERMAAVLAKEDSVAFAETLTVAGDCLGSTTWAAITAAPAYKTLRAGPLRAAVEAEPKERALADQLLKSGLTSLGLLADASAACNLIDACVSAGLSPADPRLEILHLNAALQPEPSP